ncbi:nitrous oxide reductase family maturation protein NosD [Terribacillus saccharophilus]|uniref:right-handed parallel beta-helix repeat-containing protein n=1 Tax=Terribacillus saccharophilus TaxID=361277 RepID=UPI003981B8BC
MRITILAAIVLCLIGAGIYSIASNNKKEVEAVTASKQLFVATDGDDDNEGTKEKPLRTIQAAVDQATAGTTVYIRSGTYTDGFDVTHSGTKEAPVIIRNFEDEQVIISGKEKVMKEDAALVNADGKQYITIQGLTIQDLNADSPDFAVMGIFVTGNSSHINIIQNHIHHIGNISDEGNAHGIAVYGTGKMEQIRVMDNIVEDLTLGLSEAVVLNGNIDGFAVTGNTVRNNNNIGIDLIGYEGTSEDPDSDYVRNGTVRGNVVHDNSSYGNPAYGEDYSAGGIYVDGAKNIKIKRNTVFRNDLGIEATSEHKGQYADNIEITENAVYENNYTGISIGGYDEERGGTKNSSITYNVLFRNDTKDLSGGQLLLQHDISGNDISHNVFSASKTGLFIANDFQTNTNTTMDRNVYDKKKENSWVWKQQEYNDFEEYKEAAGQEEDSAYIEVDYMDVSSKDFTLKEGTTAQAVID